MLVADASLVVELALDRLGEQAGILFGDEQELAAPCLLWSEVPSVINEMAFRGEISRALATRAIERFVAGKLQVSERRHPELTMTAVAIAEQLGWAKTYDAEYLALARLLDTRVVTLDLRLRRGAERLGLVVTPDELTGPADVAPAVDPDESPPAPG
ncbi:MAG TPA: type II toxin-antitoxin system VapC family toxin, partial [Solirubrobacteraceae bacterium]|nr:type II toxin-antitoxin system VapC family toxin [Solirubrobacteraceae bacterium]